VRLEGLVKLKTFTSSGLEPANFRLVAYCLNHSKQYVAIFFHTSLCPDATSAVASVPFLYSSFCSFFILSGAARCVLQLSPPPLIGLSRPNCSTFTFTQRSASNVSHVLFSLRALHNAPHVPPYLLVRYTSHPYLSEYKAIINTHPDATKSYKKNSMV
jgi:hypothetical protein